MEPAVTIKANETLDVRKKVCPMPVLLTKRKLQTMQLGDILEVVGDYACAAENIQRSVEQAGHRVLKVTKGLGNFVIFIQKMNK